LLRRRVIKASPASCRSARLTASWRGSELDAVRAVVLPRPARLDELAGGNHRRVAENGDQIALTPAFTRSTQNPFSSLWKVTRSTSPPRTSVAVLVPARCPTVEIWS